MGKLKEKISKYRELKFKSELEFNDWLGKTATKQIWFRDKGQDLSTAWIEEMGEIIHVDIQGIIWNGKFVDMESLTVGVPLRLWDDKKQKWGTMHRLYISEVIDLLKSRNENRIG